jgi:fatty acid-binding protein DegV
MEPPQEQRVFINTGACPGDAEKLRQMIHERLGVSLDRFVMGDIGPVIGSHSGPGTLALFFLAKNRG